MKKVLIVTYYWPPAGGPGVQRWLKFVKYLPGFGVEPVVYIPENPSYPILDSNLADDVSPELTIIKGRILEPYALASIISKKDITKISSGIVPNQKQQTFLQKIALWIRGNLFIPDARVLWVSPSVRFLKKYILENSIDTIITTGPPHSLHLIGLRIKKQNPSITWIADFRDPWTTIGYHRALKLSAYAKRKHKKLERDVLQTSDTVIVTSKTTKAEFAKLTNRPIEVITNGYDQSPPRSVRLDKKFSVAHIGSLLSQRNPEVLWQVFSELINEQLDFGDHFELKLIGTVSQEVLDSIDRAGLSMYTSQVGYVSHDEALQFQRSSQVLLLIEIDSEETKSIIPGKLFEYMASGRPIVAIGPKGSDFAGIIAKTNTGIFVSYDEKESLRRAVNQYFQSFLAGELRSNAVGIDQYSRKNLTGKLSELILRSNGNCR